MAFKPQRGGRCPQTENEGEDSVTNGASTLKVIRPAKTHFYVISELIKNSCCSKITQRHGQSQVAYMSPQISDFR